MKISNILVSFLLLSCSSKNAKEDPIKNFMDNFSGVVTSAHIIVVSDYGCSGCKSVLLENTLSRDVSDTTIIVSNIDRTSNYNMYLEQGYTNLILDSLDLAAAYGIDLIYPVYYNRLTGKAYPLSIEMLKPESF